MAFMTLAVHFLGALVSPFHASAHRQQHLSGIHHMCKTVVIPFRLNKIASVFYTERSV